MMNVTYQWQLIAHETPKLQKDCSRCANTEFVCSEKFRINSCKKMTDVWLIYKCTQCDFRRGFGGSRRRILIQLALA